MRKILQYLNDYLKYIDKRICIYSCLFIAVSIFINYRFHLNEMLSSMPGLSKWLAWYIIFLIAFAFPYVLLSFLKEKSIFFNKYFILLFFSAPGIFAVKMTIHVNFRFVSDALLNEYWNLVVDWPLKLIFVFTSVFLLWKASGSQQPFYGTRPRNIQYFPYLLLLIFMVPLVAIASTQHDFLAMYPKLNHVSNFIPEKNRMYYKVIYELSYGTDFFSIELFFRGFLIIAFVRWVGKDAILPMACFYCTIHFGKPPGECISSFFGGTILGIIVYYTRNIFGGLMVHLGTAWMMEAGGYFGSLAFHY